MNAKYLFNDIQSTYLHLERYVNDGSPSGFSETKTTSEATSPYNGADRFPILEFMDDDLECVLLGANNQLFMRGVNYAHPDSRQSALLLGAGRNPVNTAFEASPTASGRTMLIRPPARAGYLKLSYDVSRLGRVDRQLSLKICQSSLEVTQALKYCIDKRNLPPTFSLFLEPSSKVSLLPASDGIYEWGVIYREAKPYPYRDSLTQIVPGFSLFSKDRRNNHDDSLITQLIALSGREPRQYLIDLLKIIVDSYWSVVLNCAFHPEAHAQNCLFEIDESFNIARLVLIDMQSVDKDIPLARHLGLNDKWASYPASCFDENIYFYNIRSSFIYDFKVGEYLLTPLIAAVARRYDINVLGVEEEIRQHVQSHYTPKLPSWYFPSDGCWYDCEKTERKPGQKRQYYPHKDPKYR